jgi:CheY-like chemotaxis protein
MKRVLVVTEDVPAQQMFQTMLTAEGFDVLVQTSLDDATGTASAFMPDVILIAVDAARAAQATAMQRPPALSVPMMVVAPLPTGPHAAIRLDADAFVPFPISQPTLVQAVQRLCDDPPRVPKLLVIHGTERRRLESRPSAGSIKPCPRCGAAMRFHERHGEGPAWLCVNVLCRNQEFVRAV